jgi:serine protease
LAFLVFTSALALAPFNKCAYDKADDNVYLFMFHAESAPDCSTLESLQKFFDIRARGAKVTRAWSFINGGAVDLSNDLRLIDSLRSIPEMLVVEENCLARIPRGETPLNFSSLLEADPQRWNLYREDQCTLAYSTDLAFNPPNFGSGINAWVLDTGILPTHQEFTGRAVNHWSGYPGPNAGIDRNGHGTHCGGTIGGANVGFARSARIYSNQVLNAQGSGSYDIVVEGVNQAVSYAKTTAGPDVISMSLGGPVSDTLDAAINAASNGNTGGQKIPVIVAAGNDGASAIGYSPCRAAQAICVGATTSTDTLASYSNHGSKVNVLAPGSSIYSAYYTSNSAYATMSGTSMACPAAVGAACIYGAMNNNNLTPDGVRSGITSFSTKNAINRATSLPAGTPNLLCYDHWKACSA